MTRVSLLTVVALLIHGGVALAGGETFGHERMWLPEEASTFAPTVDKLFYLILYLTGGVMIGVFALMILFLIQYRHQPGRRARFVHGNNTLELVWTLVPAVILVLITSVSQTSWSAAKTPFTPPTTQQVLDGEVVEIGVIGRQFAWYFQYPGEDGVLGARDRTPKQSADFAEMIGLNRESPGGADDFVSPIMVTPVNKKVYVHLSSVDVLHSFYLPNFRIKQDAVPGLVGKVWLEATKTSAQVVGSDPANPLRVLDQSTMKFVNISDSKPFDIICAELCGQGHFKMRGVMYVVDEPKYREFLRVSHANMKAAGDTEEESY